VDLHEKTWKTCSSLRWTGRWLTSATPDCADIVVTWLDINQLVVEGSDPLRWPGTEKPGRRRSPRPALRRKAME